MAAVVLPLEPDGERRRLSALVEHGADCIALIDADERIRYASPALLRSLGYAPEEMLGACASGFTHPDDLPSVDQIRECKPGSEMVGIIRLRHKDGSWRHHEGVAKNLLHDPAIGAFVCNRRDVTDRVRYEEQARQSQKMEAIGLLAGGVAHDFNNLLGAILGYASLASRTLKPEDTLFPHLKEISAAAQRGAELTRKLLAFSRKQIIQPRLLDVHRSVEDFMGLLKRIVGEDVELVVEAPAEAIVAQFDAVQLEQVLLNLCTNARQAMPIGGELRLATRAADLDHEFVRANPWAKPGSFAQISVSDNGVGMDPATRARIFEPFFTTKPEGTGLGLATVYGIVQQHGGFIHVESQRGEGSTFHVFLPRALGAVPESSPRVTPEDSRGTESILLAEDEPSLRALVETTLTELGYRVLATADGEQAVRAYEERGEEFALVVLDVVMPRLGAREVYDRIRGLRPDVKVLFTTGYAPESTRLDELLADARHPVLEKPFTPHELAAMVRSTIDG